MNSPRSGEGAPEASEFVLPARAIDLRAFSRPKPMVIWTDFLGSVLLADGSLYLAATSAFLSVRQGFWVITGAVFLFRALAFLHETTHVGARVPFLRTAYNVLMGFGHKLPLYTYTPHTFHHTVETYGTAADPEYERIKGRPVDFLLPVFTQLASPLLLLVRFGFFPILLPFIGKRGRELVFRHASTFMLNFRFERPAASGPERRQWYFEDAACFLYNAAFFGLMVAGVWSWRVLLVWYAATYLAFVMNFFRAMVSHSYGSSGERMSRKMQVMDSVTFGGTRALEWLYPVGLRYHALHHLFPQVPYHNLARLHRALLAETDGGHPYRRTVAPSYRAAALRLPR